MTIPQLQELLDSGEFHHATSRNEGKLWDGLHIYRHDPDGFRGFTLCGRIPEGSPDLKRAEEMVRHTGISLNFYGNG